jgi:hypothetical protein
MGRPLLITPSQLWNLLLSRYRLKPSDFDPGLVSDVVHTGTGLGTIRITDLPYDAYVAELRVTTSGDSVAKIGPVTAASVAGKLEVLGVPKGSYAVRVEIMAAGFFRYSLDGGMSYSTLLPIPSAMVGRIEIPGSGMTFCFVGTFAPMDLFTFLTVGVARISATIWNVSTPLEPEGTGTVTISGQSSAVSISVCALCSDKFVYSINGGKPSLPTPITSTFVVPCVGAVLTFDPGCTSFTCGGQWIFSTRGAFSFDASNQPLPLARPEQTGLRLVFDPSVASPAYVAGDLYAFSTNAPPDVLEECRAASDEALAKLRARYFDQVILAWDRSVTINAGRIALGALYDRKGWNHQEDYRSIGKNVENAHAFFLRVGSKLEHPLIVAQPLPGILAPRVIIGPDDTDIGAGPFGADPNDPFGPGVIVPSFFRL